MQIGLRVDIFKCHPNVIGPYNVYDHHLFIYKNNSHDNCSIQLATGNQKIQCNNASILYVSFNYYTPLYEYND